MRWRAAGSTLRPLLKEAQTHPVQIELLQPGPPGKKGHGMQGKQAQPSSPLAKTTGCQASSTSPSPRIEPSSGGAGQETSGPIPLAPFGLKTWPTSHALQAVPTIHLSQTAIAW